MRLREYVGAALIAGAMTTGVGALSVPAFAANPSSDGDMSPMACGVKAYQPTQSGTTLTGRTGRGGCSNTTTYLWSYVKRDINNWPDATHASNYDTYVTNGWVDARGACGPGARYYTEGAATPLGASDESGHPWRC